MANISGGSASNLPKPPNLLGLPDQLVRWLTLLWQRTSQSATDQQARSYSPPPVSVSGRFDNVESVALAAVPARSDYRTLPGVGLAEMAYANSLMAQSKSSSNNISNVSVSLQGLHADRISQGTGSITGNTLTASTGTFSASWINYQIAIGYQLFFIVGYTSSTVVTLSGSPPAGACSWYMSIAPAINYNVGTIFLETDRSVVYRIGTGNGTANIAGTVVNWVSGPQFNPYMAGKQIYLGGVAYTILTAIPTQITLNVSYGTATGVAWIVTNGFWFYHTGCMEGNTAGRPTDLDYNTDSLFLYHDTQVGITYYLTYDSGVGGSYFAWWGGTASLTLAAAQALTLRAEDAGYTVWVTDYDHVVQWTGSAWQWGPGDSPAGQIGMFTAAPVHGLWYFCDGTATTIMKIVAGALITGSFTSPNLNNDTFIRGAGVYSGPTSDPGTSPTFASGLTFTGTAATLTGTVAAPTFSGTPATLTGTVGAPVFTGTPATLTGTVSAPIFTGSALASHAHAVPIGLNGTNFEIQTSYGTVGAGHTGANNIAAPAGGAAFSDILTSSVSAGTPAGTNSAPTLAMNSYTPAGTNSAPSLVMNSYTPAGVNTAPSLAMNSYTPAGTIGGTATIGIPTVGSGAPKSLALLFYVRR
jgi:hypothetical protein